MTRRLGWLLIAGALVGCRRLPARVAVLPVQSRVVSGTPRYDAALRQGLVAGLAARGFEPLTIEAVDAALLPGTRLPALSPDAGAGATMIVVLAGEPPTLSATLYPHPADPGARSMWSSSLPLTELPSAAQGPAHALRLLGALSR